MSAQHTNGRLYPLQGDPSVLHAEQGARGRRVCCTESFGDKDENNANARRLAACWNACDGISTESLERSDVLSGMNQQRRQLETQRDDLLSALDRIDAVMRDASGWPDALHELSRLEGAWKQAMEVAGRVKGGEA